MVTDTNKFIRTCEEELEGSQDLEVTGVRLGTSREVADAPDAPDDDVISRYSDQSFLSSTGSDLKVFDCSYCGKPASKMLTGRGHGTRWKIEF